MDRSNESQSQILARYAGGPDLLQAVIQGLEDTQLDLTLTQEGWSIRQLIHHIADGDYLWKEFLLRAAGEPEGEFSLEWYWCLPQDEWVKRWSYAEREVSHSLTLLQVNRQHTPRPAQADTLAVGEVPADPHPCGRAGASQCGGGGGDASPPCGGACGGYPADSVGAWGVSNRIEQLF